MANNLIYAAALRTIRLDTIITDIDSGAGAGTLRIYDDTAAIPADADASLGTNVLLAQLTLSDPCGSTTGDTLTFSAITADSSADATGTANFFRILDSDANVVLQGTVGLDSGTFDLELNSISIAITDNVAVSSATITSGNQ